MRIKFFLIITFCGLISQVHFAVAQKLPNVQQASVRVPSSIKIDGKASEWDNQFQAHNNATNLYYTMANDDENLYLIVQAIHPRVIEKIIDVGVSLVIGNKGDKASANLTVTYPSMENIKNSIVYSILSSAGDKGYWYSGRKAEEILTRTDSTVMRANKVFDFNSKYIKTTNLKGISDTIISRYNDQGIKVAALFGNNGAYTYELKIPLKYLGLSIANFHQFNYCIRLNDWNNSFFNTGKDSITHELIDADPDLNSTTEFWGEYTLAKK